MTVDITQDEMNILNLNGVSVDEVKSNIELSRAAGMDDETIRLQFTDTIEKLKPITKQSFNDAGKIEEWQNKGGITPFEYANRKAVDFNGNYSNIDNNANLSVFEKQLKNNSRNAVVDAKVAKEKQAKLERNQRVNDGTASFVDRAGAALDRWGNASYEQQKKSAVQDYTSMPATFADGIKTDVNNTNKIDFGTSLGRSFMSGEWLPYVGGFISGAEDKKIRDIKERILNNQPIREDELNFLNYKLEQQKEENVRGFTFGGQIAKDFLPSLIRFGAEIAAAGWMLKGFGLTSELPQSASLGQKAVHGVKEMGKYGLAGTLLPTSWNEGFGAYQERMKNNEMEFTDKGSWIFKNSHEKPATAFMKSLGSVFAMFASEASGQLLGIPVQGVTGAANKYLGTPIGKYLRENKQLVKLVDKAVPELSKIYEKINKMPVKGKTLDWLKSRVKFDGFLEEMGEEAVEDVLNLIIGTNNEERNLENYSKAIFKSPDEWAIIAGAIALQGGTLSAASHILGGYMERNGATDEEILDVMQKTSEIDKEKMIEDLISDGIIDVSEYTNEEQEKINKLKNHFYTQNKNAGLDDAEGISAAEIQSHSIAKLAKNIGMDIEDVKKAFNISTQSLTDEQAKQQLETDTKILQGRVEKHNQELQSKSAIENIENSFNDSIDNLTQYIQDDVNRIIQENNLDTDEFNFEDIRFYGSYTKGKNKKSSDLDVLVQYSGSMREDDAFNMFADAKLYLTDAKGKKVKIDINPINTDNSGTIDEHIKNMNDLAAETAGAEAKEISSAKKEWQEKGTDSQYFKKWFSDSKVVDEQGKPLVVYHATNNKFNIFQSGNSAKIFYFAESMEGAKNAARGNKNIMPVYLSLKKPVNSKDNPINWYEAENTQNVSEWRAKGFDGVYVKDEAEISIAVFNPEQIKSVDNKGTFDNTNPNIYYQSAMRRSRFDDFAKFYQDVLSKPKNTKNKEQFNALTKNGINLRIPHDTILHEQKKHKLTAEQWQDLLNNIDDVSASAISSQKPRFNGKPVLLKVNTEKDTFGIVLETFEKNNPIVATAFIDSEKNIDNWLSNEGIKNEAIPSGTKTTFLGNRLKDIITQIQPKFKPFSPNIYYQSVYHGSPYRFDEFSLEHIGNGEGVQAHGWGLYFAENKEISENYRKNLADNKVFYDGKEIKDATSYNYLKVAEEGKSKLIKELKEKIKTNEYYFKFMDMDFTRAENLRLIGEYKRIKKAIKKYNNKNHPTEQEQKQFLKDSEEYKSINNTLDIIENVFKVKFDFVSLEKNIKAFKKDLKLYRSIDESKIKIERGQLFKVDVPDADVLLDEDKSLTEQSEKVIQSLKELDKKEDLGLFQYEFKSHTTGKEIYERIGKFISTRPQRAEMTSKLLNQYGIKGITYDGRQDGRCYVIFDDKAIKVLETYYQSQNGQGGIDNSKGFTYQRFNFDGTAKENLIVLLKNKSDKSTLLHEFAHVYLTTLNNLALTNTRAKDLLTTVNKWLRYNGVEYTTAQHEKFANGFVAYIKTGKAPSYGLKKAFENFRRWLGDLYSELQFNDNIEIDDETKLVFDELLGDRSTDVQKRISDDIIKKAKENALLRLREENADKKDINFNQLSDKQKRYRDTAYNIIWYALSHSKNEEGKQLVKDIRQLYMLLGNDADYNKKTKGVKHQQEKLTMILSEVEDVFSGNDGFLHEWGEFFTDPGVSYHNDDIKDADLAMQALDVIVNKKYLYDTEAQYTELSNEDIKKAQYELEYIINSYKNAKDKTNSVAAFFEWIDSQHPYVQDDFLNKWENDTNEIDRYQALSKFQQAKEDLKIYAATLKGHGDYSSQFAEYARKIIKRLDFMTEHDKMKIFDKLKAYNSFREIERNLDDVMDYAETLADVSERKALADKIDREVMQTIHEWQNGIKKTKYTYPANKLFTRLRQIDRMNQEQIQYLYDAHVNDEIVLSYVADEVHDEDYYETIESMFITFKANGSYYNTTEFLQDLLNRIQSAKFTAKVARDEIDFERKMQQINLVDECAKALDTHKGKVSKIEMAYRHGFNLNSALEMMFNKNIKNKFSLDYLYAQKDARVGKDRDEVLNKIAEVFGYKGASKNILLFNKFIDMTKKEFQIRQRYTPDMVNGTYRITSQEKESGQTITEKTVSVRPAEEQHKEWQPELVHLSRMEVLYYYIQAKNRVSYKMLTDMGDETTPPKGQFDMTEFHELLANLTEQEKLMGDILQLAAEKYYPELNKYHIEKYHVDLGRVNAYYPRKSETPEVRVLELFNDYVQQKSNASFQKTRTAGPGIRISPANALAVLFDHIEKSNTLIVMGRQLDLMNRVFKENNLKKKIEAVWGIDTAKEFMLQVTANLYGGQISTISEAEAFIGRIENNVIKAQIFAKPQVGLKQIISFMNYGVGDEFVSAKEWAKEFGKQTFTPKEWKKNIEYMMNIDYLRDRFARGGSTDALKRQLEQRLFAKLSLFDDLFSAPIRLGDIGAIILGGKPYINVLLKKGYSEEQAIKIFIEKTVNDQQSSIPSTLSNIQRNAAKQPLAKMFFAYQNTPWQYFRTASNAIIRFKQNPDKKTGLNMLKLVGLYMYIFPLIFNIASSLSPLIFASSGDDDELKNDIWKSIIGGITFIPIAGMFINAIYSGVQGERASTGNWFDTAASKFSGTIRKVKKGDYTPLDIYNAAALFGEAFTGIPFTTIGADVSGAADIITGDVAKGALKIGGYTDYRAKAVTGEN